MAIELQPATPAQFDEIYPVLSEFANPRMSREDWRRMMFDLPWPVAEDHRGFVLRDGDEVVGFIGTIFSSRLLGGVTHRFCNLSSWIVRDSHRNSSLRLLAAVLALKSHTLVALTPSGPAYDVYVRVGFRPLETAKILLPPLARPGNLLRVPGTSVTTRIEAIRAELDEPGRAVADHMAGTLAGQALLRVGVRRCHLVATRTPWKGRWRLAHVLHASDWGLFWEHATLASFAFSRVLGTVGLRVDSRHLSGRRPPLSIQRALTLPDLYRPAIPELLPSLIDGLYTEVVGLRW